MGPNNSRDFPNPPRQQGGYFLGVYLTGLTHKTKETGFLAGDFADEIEISRSETRFLRKSYLN